jgi:hypothetical protein
MRTLTALELAIGVALLTTVAAATVPTFFRNLRASRLAEPIDGLKRLAERASLLASGSPTENAYPESAPLTPSAVPRGELVLDPPGTWDGPTWRALDFGFDVPHAFSFSFDSHNAAERSTFSARARGDLDGDGVTSSFEITGSVSRAGEPALEPLDIYREVE